MSELNKAEKYVLENLKRLSEEGVWDENPRPKWEDGSDANSLFITPVFETYDLTKGEFPITELRPIAWKMGSDEMSWIYKDQSNDLKLLRDKYGITWWDEFDVGDGTIGNRYGHTVKEYDLMNKLLKGIEDDPFSRRHILSMWQYSEFETKGLNPCWYEFLITVTKVEDKMYMDMTSISRANDYLTAGHINRIQYVNLLMRIACHCNMIPRKYNVMIQNLHLYDKHLDNAEVMFNRAKELKAREVQSTPKLILNVPSGTNFYDISTSDFELVDYNPIKPQLKFELAI